MANEGFLPTTSTELIQLEPYGGKGTLKIRGLSTAIKGALAAKLKELAYEDGITLDENAIDPETIEVLEIRFNYEITMFMIQKSIVDYPGKKFGKELDMETIEGFSQELIEAILNCMTRLNTFPLEEGSGKAPSQKKERKTTSKEV